MRALLIFIILLLISIIAIEGRGGNRRKSRKKTYAKGTSKQRPNRRRNAITPPPKEKKRFRGDSSLYPESNFQVDIFRGEGPGFASRIPGLMDDYDIDPYYDNGSGSGANLVPMRRNTGPSENMFVAHTNMKKVVEDLLRKYDGSKPLLVGVPYPVVYEIPARRHYPQPPPPPTYPAIYERDLEHRSPYSPQPQRPHRDYPEPPIPDYRPTYSNPQPLPPRQLEPRIPDHRETYLNPRPLPSPPNTYPDAEYDPLLLDGYSEEEVDGRYPPVNDDKNAPFRPPQGPENSVDNPNIGFDVFQRERIDALHEKLRPHERSNNIDQNFEMYQDDPTLVRPPPPGARGNPEYRDEPRKPIVNKKTIGPMGHPGKPTKGFGGDTGVRTLDISEYEDSREQGYRNSLGREYEPEGMGYGPEDPPPDRSRQYTDPRGYGPEYPPPDRL